MHGGRPPPSPRGSENSPADASVEPQHDEVPRCRNTLPPCHKRREMALRSSLAIIRHGCSMNGVLDDRSIDFVLAVLPACDRLSPPQVTDRFEEAASIRRSQLRAHLRKPQSLQAPTLPHCPGSAVRMETIPELTVIIAFIRRGSQNVGSHHR